MHIAFVAQPFEYMHPPVRAGSLGLWIYYMSRLCVQRGHQAVVFGNHGQAFSAGSTRCDGVEYIFTPTGFNRLLNKACITGSNLLASRNHTARSPQFASSWHHRGYAEAVGRRARRLDCDLVHVMNYSQFVPVIRRIHPRATIALHMQCEWLTQVDPSIIRPRLQQTDIIIGCSEYITRTIVAAFPEHANRCVTVPNAADIAPVNSEPLSDSKTVLFVGRLSPEKGVHDLIRAFHLVLKRMPDAQLRLVGGAGSAPLDFLVGISDDPHVAALRVFYKNKCNGTKDPYLEALEKEAGTELGKRIVFEGSVKHDQIEKCYQRAALLVNASLSESFGISLVEAMMRQIPVVATRVGGMTYTVNPGVTGLLVEPANPNSLAEAICNVLADPKRARQMGAAGRKRAVETFSWEKTSDLLLDEFQKRCRSRNV